MKTVYEIQFQHALLQYDSNSNVEEFLVYVKARNEEQAMSIVIREFSNHEILGIDLKKIQPISARKVFRFKSTEKCYRVSHYTTGKMIIFSDNYDTAVNCINNLNLSSDYPTTCDHLGFVPYYDGSEWLNSGED